MKAYKNYFEKLKVGALLRSIQKENSEPENIALGQVSKELRYLQRQSQYVTEIERVLRELRLTIFLIKGSRTADVPDGVSKQDLLVYYQGNFFTLVHQMKDKILQLVNLMTETTIPEKPAIENDIKLADLLKNKVKILQAIGVETEMREWEQDSQTSKISVVLRKRLFYHHRISGLQYNNDFLNLNFTDIATQDNFQQALSDYGKEQIKKMREESIDNLFSEALSKAEGTLGAIYQNIEKISEALVKYFKLPISQEEIEKTIDDQNIMFESFKVVNRSSMDKIPETQLLMLDAFIQQIKQNKEQIEVIYLVGSLGRGEYEDGYSDINIYVILNIDELSKELPQENDIFNLKVFTKAQFLSEQYKKYRIITKIDGIILHGEDITKEEKLPKAGLFLALILNDDIIDILNSTKQ